MRGGETYNVLEEVDYRVVVNRPAMLRSLGDGPDMVADPGCMDVLKSRTGTSPSQLGRTAYQPWHGESFSSGVKRGEKCLGNLQRLPPTAVSAVKWQMHSMYMHICGAYIWMHMF